MVIRVVEGVIRAGAESEFAAAARAMLDRFKDVPGMRRARMARRSVDSGMEFLWVSEWDDMASLIALVGDADAPPLFVTQNPGLIESWTLRHYEVFDDATVNV